MSKSANKPLPEITKPKPGKPVVGKPAGGKPGAAAGRGRRAVGGPMGRGTKPGMGVTKKMAKKVGKKKGAPANTRSAHGLRKKPGVTRRGR